ncbi:MAG: hypothetical protein LKM40_06435 [Mageeibacillus sp.]|jgi:hypothetical protein|nr:hypothetical protein [Mageeibacillus sp.]
MANGANHGFRSPARFSKTELQGASFMIKGEEYHIPANEGPKQSAQRAIPAYQNVFWEGKTGFLKKRPT